MNNRTNYVTDIEGNSYKTIKIGYGKWCQEWMAENLNVEHYKNGDLIPYVKNPKDWTNLKSGGVCYPMHDIKNVGIYGKLYNWYAVNDPRGLAPEGWHIPSEKEWRQLIRLLDGEEIAGKKMKDTKMWIKETWQRSDEIATNSCGFTALPAGMRFNDGLFSFNFLGRYSFFWSSSEYNSNIIKDAAWKIGMVYTGHHVVISDQRKNCGLSCRCIKN